ncbi:MarR-like DNA-binding transcriptional regulator SgrR of sgrS sRNA [Tumebacillus sp. BK434]|uniref:SgrR family transcriptional regulator n=1 Tax=Tumebacillus sp. BK434 TaxID=2512169 RepID=UPI0010E4C039|nr:SgrR family transcriptional regulator [Tumebacillus sp. BK434]TCP58035.1 MarR-like DNA-binding transcriptional regulator SgrR of sgrS sRNA [Tumebacillus sp. BK434]
MQPVHHYIRLTEHLPHAVQGQALPITLEEIAAILCCTPRNAKLIVKRLAEQNWMHWQPGRGRGHTSLVTLQILPADLLFSLAQELVRTGDIRAANELIGQYAPNLPALRTRYQSWLASHFGFHAGGASGAPDILRITHSNPLDHLDPALCILRSETHLVKHIFDTLVRRDPASGDIRPHLAHHWEISADGTVYTFYLRKSVLFHNGTALTARDAAFTMERMQRESFFPWMFSGVVQVQATGDLTLLVKLDAPNQLFLHFLSSERAAIVPAEYCRQIGADFPRLPVGSGPFKVIRNDDAMLVLEAFTPYFRERAWLDRIEIWFMTEPSVQSTLQYNQPTPGWASSGQLERSFQMLTFNLNKQGPQLHPAFREALSLALDRCRLIEDLGGTRHAPATRFDVRLEPDVPAAAPPDPGRIRQLLAESGYDGTPLLLSTYFDDDHIEDADWIQRQCALYGIPLTIRPLPYREMITAENIAASDLILDGATMEDDTEMSYLDLLQTRSSFLADHLSPEQRRRNAATIHKLLQKSDRAERLALLQEIEAELLESHAVLPLYRLFITVSTRPELHGVSLNSQGWVDYRNLWLKEARDESKI